VLLSKAQKVDVPHEAGSWFMLRPLSWLQCQEARDAQGARQRTTISELGPEFLSALTSGNKEDSETAIQTLEAQRYHLDNFSLEVILGHGIVSWSYVDANDEEIPVTQGTLEQLDEATATWAAKAILGLTAPKEEEGRTSDATV